MKSGAEARAVSRKAGLSRLPDVLEFREAFGVRAGYRRFTSRHAVWTNRTGRHNLTQRDQKRPGWAANGLYDTKLGNVRTMSAKSKFPIWPMLFWIIFIGILAAMRLFDPVLFPIRVKMDEYHLAKFAQKIAISDHVVAWMWTHYHSRKETSLSLTGEDAKRVVQAVSSASSGRPPSGMAWANMYLVTATFFRGTNVLGKIVIDAGELFKANGREYRDVGFKQDGHGGSGVLKDLICAPLGKIVRETEEKELESQ